MIEQVIISTQADTSCAEQEYQGLRGEIVSLKKQLDLLEEGTEEYTKTFTQLSNKMFEQRERTLALKNSSADLGKLLGNVSGIAGTISQGFAGATSALSLFGIESEELVKTIQKVQALESLARTFESFEDAPKKVKALINNIKGLLRGPAGTLELNVAANSGPDTKAYAQAAASAKSIQVSSAASAVSAQVSAAANSASSAASGESLPNLSKVLSTNKENSIELAKGVLFNTDSNKLTKDQLKRVGLLTNNNKVLTKVSFDKLKLDQAIAELKKNGITIDKESINGQEKIAESTEKTKTATEGATKAASGLGSTFKSIGIGLGITAAIAAVTIAITKLVDYFKKLNDSIKQSYETAIKYNEEYATAITSSTNDELSKLKVLEAGYKNLGTTKELQNKYLKDNAKYYEEIGIDVNKIIAGEQDYQKEIEKATNLLKERGKTMGIVNLLIEKYARQAELQTQVALNAQSIYNINPFNFTFVRSSIEDIGQRVTEAISLGYGNAESILKKIKADIIAENKDLLNKGLIDTTEYEKRINKVKNLTTDQISQFNAGVNTILSKIPDDTQEKMKAVGTELTLVNKTIAKLEPQVIGLFEESDKGTAAATTSLKTQSELLTDILNLRTKIQLANPIDNEYFRNLENEFDNLKESARKIFIDAINSGVDTQTALIAYNKQTDAILNAQIVFNNKYQEGVLANAKWVRDNEIRQEQEIVSIQEDKYSTVLKAVEASYKGGAIKQEEFIEDFANIQKAVGTSFKTTKEFYEYMEKEFPGANKPFTDFINNLLKDVNDNKISLEAAKKSIEDKFKIKLDIDPSSVIDLGTLSEDQFNFIQKIFEIYDTYNTVVADSNKKTRDDNRATNNQILLDNLQLNDDLYNAAVKSIEKIRNLQNIEYYKNIGSASGFDKFKRGDATFDFLIREQQAIIDTENARQLKLENDIKLIDENIKLYDKDSQAYIDAVKAKQEAEAELTQSQLTEAEAQAKINDIKFQKFMSTIDDIQTIVGEFGNAIKSIYEAQETLGLANLKKLLNARKITQDQYEKEADALSLKYAKKRQQTEIFQGLLAATSTSISAFASAMRPDSGLTWPYNLIAAGATSAAAFAAVIAQVATLRSLSVDSSTTSVNPATTSTGLGLNYSLNQQEATTQRLLNNLTDTRVYVLESDITSTQAKIREIEEMSTF